MEFSLANLFFAMGAGIASILSPCVLPVLPIVMAGKADEHPLRPVAVVSGLTGTFVVMGMITSLFGSLVNRWLMHLEKPVAIVIGVLGLLILVDVNPFKRLQTGFQSRTRGGLWGGFILGASLGLIWIPCVGPFLSSILAMVAGRGQVFSGMILLLFYSLGFAIPMLIAGYGSHFFRTRMKVVRSNPVLIRILSGLLLLGLSAWIFFHGLFGF